MDNRACGDVRFGTDPLGYGKGFVQQSIDDAGGSGLRGIAIGFLELPRIWGSPKTMESRLEATVNRCVIATSSLCT